MLQKKKLMSASDRLLPNPPTQAAQPHIQLPGNPAGSAAAGPSCSQRLTKNPTLQQASAAPEVI